MIKSPCKNCDRHKKDFPGCLEMCKRLEEIQQRLVKLENTNMNYEYSSSNVYEFGITTHRILHPSKRYFLGTLIF